MSSIDLHKQFDSLDAYLKNILDCAHGLAAFKARSPFRPQHVSKTLLEYAHFSEEQISLIISELFKYNENGKYPLLQSFLDRFFLKKGLTVAHPKIMTEYHDIDICIIDDEYVIIFENKINGAAFQHNQMARYIHWAEMYQQGKKILTVLLSKTGSMGSVSTWRFPKKGFMSCKADNSNTLCKCDFLEKFSEKDGCKECLNYENHEGRDYKEQTVLLNGDFAEWIKGSIEIVLSREYRLKSMMIQFSDYLDTLFNTDINLKCFYMEIQKFLKNQHHLDEVNLNSLSILSRIIKETTELSDAVKVSFIMENYQKMVSDYTNFNPQNKLPKKYECGIYVPYRNITLYFFIAIDRKLDGDYAPTYGIYIEGSSEEERADIEKIFPENFHQKLADWTNAFGANKFSTEENVYNVFKELVNTFLTDESCKRLIDSAL